MHEKERNRTGRSPSGREEAACGGPVSCGAMRPAGRRPGDYGGGEIEREISKSSSSVRCSKEHISELEQRVSYIKRTAYVNIIEGGEGQGEEDANEQEQAAAAETQAVSKPAPSSGTMIKQAKMKISQATITSFVVSAPPNPQTQKHSKSVSAMLCKTPEEVVAERHKSKTSQPTIVAKQIADDHIAETPAAP